MLLTRRVVVGALLSCALAVTCASPALAAELTEGGAAGEEAGSVEEVYQGLPSDETDPLTDASPVAESPTGSEGASDQGVSATPSETPGENSSEDGPYLSDPSSLETSYEELKLFAETHYSDMPNPQRGAEQTRLRRSVSSPFWEGPSFYFGDGTLYLSPALKVVDVSEWQGEVDWEKVKASGVDAAIIRVGYASGNEDKYLKRNISECERLGIPYGLYLYSYAYDADYAKREAVWTASLINRYDAHPDLPVFYDLEEWTWTGHTPPTKVSEYEKIVDAYLTTMKSYGYTDVSVYSYTSYLLGPLNSPSIWAKTSWVAQYNSSLTFANPYEPAFHGWQYTSSASVPGISGKADLSAFTPRGSVTSAGWRTIGGRTYYFDESGNMVRGWLDLDGKRYRLDKDYGYLWTGWYGADGKVYYARED
ncbi:GH25 family lysozyme, partial [Olsenella sp. An290]|uniref:GH25 family lysozyme n=1 Tax=Olsenella sp. An290 TaxID=1965625 RepID=UPI000B584617